MQSSVGASVFPGGLKPNRRISAACGALVFLLGAAGLAGWLTGLRRLASISDDFIPMAPNTAVAFVLGGLALALGAHPRAAWLERVAAILVGLLAVLALLPENPANRFAGLFSEAGGRFGRFPLGVMSPVTAVTFLLASASAGLRAWSSSPRAALLAGLFGAMTAAVGLLTVLGYLYGTPLFQGGATIIPLAATTGFAFLAQGVGLTAAVGVEHPPLSWVFGSTTRARLLRAFLPAAFGVAVAQTYLALFAATRTASNPAVLAVLLGAGSLLVVAVVADRISKSTAEALEKLEAERRLLEEHMRQRQKMEAVGQLAGGVAHDFNNLLTAILSFSAFVRQDLGEAHPSRADIEEVEKAARRAADLTRQLLAFSRQQVSEPQVLDLNELVRNMRKMLGRLIGEHIELSLALADELGSVKADPGQLEQVLLNLVVNARDAMPGGGKLTIETANVELDEKYVRGRMGAPAGPYVMLAVSDTGIGMDEATQSRLFEPFFTTKPRGKGTGLGLTVVQGIVKEAGGDVLVYSAPGKGTTFKVYFPRHAEESHRPAEAARVAIPRGSERVLVVDDDAGIRAVAHRALKKHGYRLLEAARPSDALKLLEAEREIELLLTDIIMPEMTGPELASRVRQASPRAQVLFMSGYPGGALADRGVLDASVAYLPKPFTPEQLALKVRAVLDARGEAAAAG